MANKNFAGIRGPVGTVEVNADYESAPSFDKVRVGKLGVEMALKSVSWTTPFWSGSSYASRKSMAACAAVIPFLHIIGWCLSPKAVR